MQEMKQIILLTLLCEGVMVWSMPSGAVIKGTERIVAKETAKVVAKTVEETAKTTARNASVAATEIGSTVAEKVTAKQILASGAAVAVVVGSCQVAAGVRNSMENLSEAGGDVMRENPERAAEIFGVPFKGWNQALAIIALGVVGILGFLAFFFRPVFGALRERAMLALRRNEEGKS